MKPKRPDLRHTRLTLHVQRNRSRTWLASTPRLV